MDGFSLEEVLGPEDAQRLADRIEALADEPAGAELAALSERLRVAYEDLRLIHQVVVAHGSEIENELSLRNERITELTENMRRYLPPQLYERIAGGEVKGSARQSQRRRITVFFSDIVGFTDMTDSVEPEVLSDVLNRYLELMVEIATRWGATIDKFIGDAVMVFFGDDDETSPEEGAWRCARMAMEMQVDVGRLLDAMSLGAGRPLRTRMGINTGVATVGNFGSVKHRMSYTAIGSTVNIASRLESAAPAGGVLISDATHHLIADRVRARARGALQLKGVAHPVETWELLGLADGQVAGRSTLSEAGGGFRLAPLEWTPGVSSELERAEMAAALERALALLRSPEERGDG
ncbi:MAG: adenylate/guanylate cyclase domain-containing protein [Alphaproteobacteria bacterium]|nr:adenylate/guanylate cyclase domain-containing protein [Alphaproteobacteria bacterium]MCB9794436.1 adenylate/guanylate cyclase domain-containing protein [Alphaproteobacteria bacterium]